MTSASQRVGAAIAEDQVVQQKLNFWQVASIDMTLPRARPTIGRWVADIVKSWDTVQITDKLETERGADLQYIRLNGAIIGGLSWPCVPRGGLTPRDRCIDATIGQQELWV
jgi:uncharacterized membrane-anchored protein YjiN (DUF445 family)